VKHEAEPSRRLTWIALPLYERRRGIAIACWSPPRSPR
jgi:hypothetical protein